MPPIKFVLEVDYNEQVSTKNKCDIFHRIACENQIKFWWVLVPQPSLKYKLVVLSPNVKFFSSRFFTGFAFTCKKLQTEYRNGILSKPDVVLPSALRFEINKQSTL